MIGEARKRLGRLLARALTLIGGVIVLLLTVSLMVFLLERRVPDRTIIQLDLTPGLLETRPPDLVGFATTRHMLSLRDVLDALERGATDDRVLGLVVRVAGGTNLGLAVVEELRDAVLAFRRTGKPALLFSETFGEAGPGQAGYYLATSFDEIVLQPSGNLGLAGLMSGTPFVRDALDRLDIEPRMESRHEYKDAAHIFTERGFTPPQEEAIGAVLESLLSRMVRAIAEDRGLAEQKVRELVDRGPYFGAEAVSVGLVDRVAYRDEAMDRILQQTHEDAVFLPLSVYLKRAGGPHTRGPQIALIHGSGMIMRGESRYDPLTGGVLGSETVAAAFRQAARDDAIQAVVFRISSSGGSYVASDVIWREVARTREAGKPVIVSMGNVAASGGYFIALPADHIVAQPSTITGSIGVVSGKVVMRGFWEKLGVEWDFLEVGGNATYWSSLHDYSPAQRERLAEELDRIYDDFSGRVARSRGLNPEELDAAARGRIWTGEDALRLGLVDHLGGLSTALRLARESLDLDPDARIRVRLIPAEPTSTLELALKRQPRGWPAGDGGSSSTLSRLRQRIGLLLDAGRVAGLLDPPGELWLPDPSPGW